MNPDVRQKIEARMRETGQDWWTVCGFFGRRGGAVSGARRSSKVRALSQEHRKQEAQGLR